MPKAATADRVDRETLLEFVRPRHQAVLLTRRRDGGALHEGRNRVSGRTPIGTDTARP